MQERLTNSPRAIDDLANRYEFTVDAVQAMLQAVAAGHGNMAQFAHREFGGTGQWMRGGLTMVSDFSDKSLSGRVAALCDALSSLLAREPDTLLDAAATTGIPMQRAARWWPDGLGNPDSSGGQGDVRYAYFARAHRLAIATGGALTLYDTLEHRINGVAQHQAGTQALRFSTELGTIDVATLPVVSGDSFASLQTPSHSADAELPPSGGSDAATSNSTSEPTRSPSNAPAIELLEAIEKLAQLRDKGVLNSAEFDIKKAELLNRI